MSEIEIYTRPRRVEYRAVEIDGLKLLAFVIEDKWEGTTAVGFRPQPEDERLYPSYLWAQKARETHADPDKHDYLLFGIPSICTVIISDLSGTPEEKRRWEYYKQGEEYSTDTKRPGDYQVEWFRDEYKYSRARRWKEFPNDEGEPEDVQKCSRLVRGLLAWYFGEQVEKDEWALLRRVTLEAVPISGKDYRHGLIELYKSFSFKDCRLRPNGAPRVTPMETTVAQLLQICRKKSPDKRGVCEALKKRSRVLYDLTADDMNTAKCSNGSQDSFHDPEYQAYMHELECQQTGHYEP